MKLFSPSHQRSFLNVHGISFFDGKLTVVARCVRSTSGWFVQTRDGETSLNDGRSIWSTWGSQKSRFFVSVASSLNLSQKKWTLCRASLSVTVSFLCCIHFRSSIPKCFNKLSSTSLCIILNDAVFRGGKREFSSIAGVDSPYHSLQVAAVTRLFFVHRAILKLLVMVISMCYIHFHPAKFGLT